MTEFKKRSSEAAQAAGVLASGVASELERPLRQVREELAEIVERLDRFIGHATGPTAFPWNDIKQLRDELAEVYLTSRRVTRLSSDMAKAFDAGRAGVENCDVNAMVESSINIARHEIGANTEVFIDLGSLPLVRVVPAQFMLAVARLLVVAARSARELGDAAISLRTRCDTSNGKEAVITIADNGAGCPGGAAAAEPVVRELVDDICGSFVGTSELGSGSAFEIRLPIGR